MMVSTFLTESGRKMRRLTTEGGRVESGVCRGQVITPPRHLVRTMLCEGHGLVDYRYLAMFS